MNYKMRTKRAEHHSEDLGELYRKAWLARLLGEWIKIFKSHPEQEWICIFNGEAYKFTRTKQNSPNSSKNQRNTKEK